MTSLSAITIIIVLLQIGSIPSVYAFDSYDVSFQTDSITVSEDVGMISISIDISGGVGFSTIFYSASDGTALEGDDYSLPVTSDSGMSGPGAVVRVNIISDDIAEGAESFTISIDSCSDNTGSDVCSVGTYGSITITIEANAARYYVSFQAASRTVSEDDGTIFIPFDINGGGGVTNVVFIPVDGTAEEGDDYSLLSASASGTSEPGGVVSVSILSDVIAEGAESFTISIISCSDNTRVEICAVGTIGSFTITIEANAGAGAGQDPHFVVPLLSSDKLCYSMQGMANFIFNLVSDAFININAYFVKPEYGNRFKEYATFLGDIGISVQLKGHKETMKNMTRIRISASDRSVTVGSSKTIVKDHSVDLLINDSSFVVRMGESTSNKKRSSVTVTVVEPRLTFEVSFVNNHVDLIFADDSGVSKNCHGIIGQFLHKEAKVINNEHININGRYIPVERLPVWDFVNTNDSCLHAKAKGGFQAEGIIEGKYTDYIVESLFSPHFYYSKFKEL